MEEFYHLIEFLIQIVFVEHIYGLGHDRMHQGMVEMHDSEMARIRHGRDMKSIAKRTLPGLVLLRGPAHCPFSISARPKDTPARHSLRSRSLCAETTRGFQF